MYMGRQQHGFIPFQVFRDLKNIRDPDMIIFQPQLRVEQEGAGCVREVVAAPSLRSQGRKGNAGVGHD